MKDLLKTAAIVTTTWLTSAINLNAFTVNISDTFEVNGVVFFQPEHDPTSVRYVTPIEQSILAKSQIKIQGRDATRYVIAAQPRSGQWVDEQIQEARIKRATWNNAFMTPLFLDSSFCGSNIDSRRVATSGEPGERRVTASNRFCMITFYVPTKYQEIIEDAVAKNQALKTDIETLNLHSYSQYSIDLEPIYNLLSPIPETKEVSQRGAWFFSAYGLNQATKLQPTAQIIHLVSRELFKVESGEVIRLVQPKYRSRVQIRELTQTNSYQF